jgi:Domain of unknown function (DUF4184)
MLSAMPYPFAHPAAVLPLFRPLARYSVPSALVIGSVVPDLWYFVPHMIRAESHSLAGVLWFCLPVGVLIYIVYHIIAKEPLAALLPQVLAARFGVQDASVPAASWLAVIFSVVLGSLSHLGWDALTHAYAGDGVNVLQHASTLLGSAFIVWWCWRELRDAPPKRLGPRLTFAARAGVLAAIMATSALAAWCALAAAPHLPLRQALRTAGAAGFEGLVAAVVAYCLLWRLARRATPRAPFRA